MTTIRTLGLLVAAGLALTSITAHAVPIVFQGGDPGTSLGSATPVSNATAAAFDAAASGLGAAHLINFEASPLGFFSSLVIAPGVTVSGLGYQGSASHSIGNAATRGSCGSVCGFNTTAGGSQYLDIDANFITFTFASGVSAFGAYLTGVQLAGETVLFSDGSSQVLSIDNGGSGAQFFGFTDAGKSITSIVFDTRNPGNALGDFIGIDDVRYVTAGSTTSVPEPASSALFGIALAGLVALRRRFR